MGDEPKLLPPQLDLWTSDGKALHAKKAAYDAMKRQRVSEKGITEYVADAMVLDGRTEAERKDAVAFMGRALILATLPHKNPGNDVRVWWRTNGDLSLSVQAGEFAINGQVVRFGLPFGSFPRLLIPLIDTEIVRTRSRRIDLGDCVTDLYRRIESFRAGKPRSVRLRGGPRGELRRFEEQTKRLATARLTAIYTGNQRGVAFRDIQIAREGFLCWDPCNPRQQNLFHSFLLVTEEYQRQVLAHPVPTDMSVLIALDKSPMEMDIFRWLNFRFVYLREEVVIPWASLQAQFGADYRDLRQFKFQFKLHLSRVMGIYHQARATCTAEGLRLQPSPTYVAKTKTRARDQVIDSQRSR
jgi:hypothetical protein